MLTPLVSMRDTLVVFLYCTEMPDLLPKHGPMLDRDITAFILAGSLKSASGMDLGSRQPLR